MGGGTLSDYMNSAHAFECVFCHGGRNEELTKAEAHSGLIIDPTGGDENKCALCHEQIAEHFATSLHNTLRGYTHLFEQRTGVSVDSDPAIRAKFDAQCNKCHATCGDCHINRPSSVGGGLIQGHLIRRNADMTNQCTACHGSRVGDEYTGRNEGLRADVHYVPGGMQCRGCHTGAEMHGDGNEYNHRYEVQNAANCGNCHDFVPGENAWHDQHGDEFSCQVCHAQDYKNCTTCHAGDGLQEPSWMDFKVGRNPIPAQRAGELVVLRHIPIAVETYESWGVTATNYASVPSFKYATPHNIVRWTSRTDTSGGQSCANACHNTPDGPQGWFLRASDLSLLPVSEQQANQSLMVPDGPPPWR